MDTTITVREQLARLKRTLRTFDGFLYVHIYGSKTNVTVPLKKIENGTYEQYLDLPIISYNYISIIDSFVFLVNDK